MKRIKIKMINTSIITMIICMMLPNLNSYNKNAVEQSSAIYEVKCSRRYQKEFNTYMQLITPTVTPTIAPTKAVKKNKPKTMYSNKEIKILQRLVEAEVTSGNIKSKENVCSVIINRVKSNSFPETIEKVIFQKHQFASISDHRYYKVKITKKTKKAVKNVINNGVTTKALYFFNIKDIESTSIKRWINNKLIYLFTDKVGHSFYSERK